MQRTRRRLDAENKQLRQQVDSAGSERCKALKAKCRELEKEVARLKATYEPPKEGGA